MSFYKAWTMSCLPTASGAKEGQMERSLDLSAMFNQEELIYLHVRSQWDKSDEVLLTSPMGTSTKISD